MRIHDVCEITNLTKKAIYFYIDEGLLEPKRDKHNNYLDFSNKDVERLKVINILRQLELPISKIKDLLDHPSMANFFLHEQLNLSRQNLLKNISLVRSLNCILNHIPPQYSFDDLLNIRCSVFDTTKEDIDFLNVLSPNKDARMIAIIVWSSFLNVETSEYRLFLWDKIIYQANIDLSNSLHYVAQVLYNLDPAEIEEDARKRYRLSHEIISVEDEDLSMWINFMHNKLIKLSKDSDLQAYWDINYDKVLIPLLDYINGNMQKLVIEYNHDYQIFLDKMELLNQKINDLLLNGELHPLYLELQSKLNHKFDIINHKNLVSFYCFEASIYFKLPYDKLLEIIKADII